MSDTSDLDKQPFSGVRVLDCTHVLAGPYCTYQLALLGAEVTRVERVEGGDLVRHHGNNARLNAMGLGTSFLGQNANKRSISINLKTSEGQELFKKMAERTDVLVENFRPGVMRRLGLDFQSICKINANVVYASLTGYGQAGAMSHAPAYDHVMQAFAGVMALNGGNGDPARISFPAIDYVTGLAGAFAISAALRQRDQYKRPQYIDVSMLDSSLAMMNSAVAQALVSGATAKTDPSIAFSGSPFSGVFDTALGLLAVTANTPKQARAFCRAIDQPGLVDEGLSSTGVMKTEAAERMRPKIIRTLLQHDADYWEQRLADAAVPAARVRSVEEAVAYAERESRDSVLPLFDKESAPDGLTRVPGTPFNLSWGGARAVTSPPSLGQHGDAVLADIGVDQPTRDKLRRAGIIGDAHQADEAAFADEIVRSGIVQKDN